MAIEKKEFILEGLDCAHCGMKIEDGISKMNGVVAASLNFTSKTLMVESEDPEHIENLVIELRNLIKKLEPQVKVNEKTIHNELIEPESINKAKMIRFAVSLTLFLIAILLKFPFGVELGLFIISYLLVGAEVLLTAIRNITKGQLFDENFLMSIATIGAFAIKEFPEGVAVMLFYQVGEFFQDLAVNRSRKSIASLMDIRPDFANLLVEGEYNKVSPYDVGINDMILIKPGEKVPLDGVIVEGRSTLDTSALTGEALPKDVEAGAEILSGSINKNGLLTVRVTKEFGESTVSKILDLVQYASSKKAPTENFITKFAKYYTPVVVFSALFLALIPPIFIDGATFTDWIHRSLVFLVVSCPCALVISIPLSFFGGIGGASQNGILIKGSNYLEALNNVHTVVFDKTGTLTKGIFKVTEVVNKNFITEVKLLEYAAYVESYSTHPIAVSIVKAYGKEIDKTLIKDYDEISGHGIKAVIQGKAIVAGNTKLMKAENISYDEYVGHGTVVHFSIDTKYAGYIVIADEVKEDSQRTVMALKELGIKRLIMLTGDSKAVADKIGADLGLDIVYSELLPAQKVEKLEMLEENKNSKGKLIFVGDGINDAPVLARADIGVAMGGLGSDAAIEAADVVLMTDEPSKLVTAIKIAKRTRNIVWQNIFFALAVKGIVLLLGAGGIATIWEAVFADVGVAVLAILNAMRVMKADY